MRNRLTASPGRWVVAILLLSGCGAPPAEDGTDGRASPAPAAGSSGVDAAGAAGSPRSQPAPSPPRGRAWVVFGTDTVVAEVARTAEERARGLMDRDELPGGEGMLFVFEEAEVRSFWMENTYIPLDIAYLDPSLRIIDIQQMDPGTTDLHRSAGPAMFALEVPQGWFAAHGIEVGDVAEIVFGG